MYDEYGNRIISSNYGHIHFSRAEITQIFISMVVLTACFTLVLLYEFDLMVALGIAAVVSVTGFLLHELAHKFVAQRYGAWAEFRMYPGGLFFALILSFLGILFAAPGAVYIQGRINRKQNGLISIAGPLTNIVFGAIFVVLWLVLSLPEDLSEAIRYIGLLSCMLAGFNLIPFGPLDGKKVLDWNPVAWVVTIGLAGTFFLIAYGII
jgi:Zn-dependent protease